MNNNQNIHHSLIDFNIILGTLKKFMLGNISSEYMAIWIIFADLCCLNKCRAAIQYRISAIQYSSFVILLQVTENYANLHVGCASWY